MSTENLKHMLLHRTLLRQVHDLKGISVLCSMVILLMQLKLCTSISRYPELLLPLSSKPPCQGRNIRLSTFIHSRSQESQEKLLPHSADNFQIFVEEVKSTLDKHMLEERAINYIFSEKGNFGPTCAGMWAEFGVASGGTVNLAARYKRDHCSHSCPPVYGFDTFTGLPEKWNRDDKSSWDKHFFDQGGKTGALPEVDPNVHLVRGLFNESLPAFLSKQAIYASSDDVVSYLHIDCDLGSSTRDVLNLLAPKMAVGTVIVFDDLVNYQYFKEHELLAMWEWLSRTGTRLLPIGMLGPLPGESAAVQLDWSESGAAPHFHQSAAFVIAHQETGRTS